MLDQWKKLDRVITRVLRDHPRESRNTISVDDLRFKLGESKSWLQFGTFGVINSATEKPIDSY